MDVEHQVSSDINEDTEIHLTYIIFLVIGIFAIIIVISCIYSTWLWRNDYYRLSGLMTATIHIVDTLSDAFFIVNITFYDDYPSRKLYIMLVISIMFMIIPAFITLYQLHSAINKWKRNDQLSQWISYNVTLLYFLSVITGSAFAGIELCTSHLFNLEHFQMPLSKTQLLKFKTKRIYSTVIFEVKTIYQSNPYCIYCYYVVNEYKYIIHS